MVTKLRAACEWFKYTKRVHQLGSDPAPFARAPLQHSDILHFAGPTAKHRDRDVKGKFPGLHLYQPAHSHSHPHDFSATPALPIQNFSLLQRVYFQKLWIAHVGQQPCEFSSRASHRSTSPYAPRHHVWCHTNFRARPSPARPAGSAIRKHSAYPRQHCARYTPPARGATQQHNSSTSKVYDQPNPRKRGRRGRHTASPYPQSTTPSRTTRQTHTGER